MTLLLLIAAVVLVAHVMNVLDECLPEPRETYDNFHWKQKYATLPLHTWEDHLYE